MGSQDQTQAENTLQDLSHKFPTDSITDEAKSLLHRLQGRYLTNQNKIGVILPLTGTYANSGQEALHGIELAVALIADTYPNSRLEFIVVDSKGDPENSAEAVNSLVTDHQVIAILGPLFGADSLAAAKQAQSLGVPMLSLSPAEGIPAVGPFIFRNALLYRNEVKLLVDYAMSTKPAIRKRPGTLPCSTRFSEFQLRPDLPRLVLGRSHRTRRHLGRLWKCTKANKKISASR